MKISGTVTVTRKKKEELIADLRVPRNDPRSLRKINSDQFPCILFDRKSVTFHWSSEYRQCLHIW